MELKFVCCKCHKEKGAEEFYRESTSKRGYSRWCKNCCRDWSRKQNKQKVQSWKVDKECKICHCHFIPRQTNQLYCGKICLQQANQQSSGYKALSRRSARNYRTNLRRHFLKMYGAKCVCCGETQEIFLTIDHVNNDGNAERQQLGGKEPYRALSDAIKVYNPTKYQVLCFNCNCGRNLNNHVCPHHGISASFATNLAELKYRQNLYKRFLLLYGTKCVCCGESNSRFLTVDHKQNDGNLERKKHRGGEPYKTIRDALKCYQPDKYQTLCFNCNCGKSKNNGLCPHKITKVVDVIY